jgi:hypothetical protein
MTKLTESSPNAMASTGPPGGSTGAAKTIQVS